MHTHLYAGYTSLMLFPGALSPKQRQNVKKLWLTIRKTQKSAKSCFRTLNRYISESLK